MPSLDRDIIDPGLARLAAEIKVATVGRVATSVRATGRAAVNLLMRFVRLDGVEETRPPTPASVVVLPRGDGYGVAFDLASGDQGVVIASDDGWDQAWRTGQAARATLGQRHTYGPTAFLPGGRREGESPANALGAMRIGAEDGTASIDLARARAAPPSLGTVTVAAAGPAASVKLGSASAASQVAKAIETKQAIVAGWTAFNAAIQADATVAPPLKLSIGAASTAAIAAIGLVSIGSVKVVVDP